MHWRSPFASKWTRTALENITPDNPQTDSLGGKGMNLGAESLFTSLLWTGNKSTEANLDTQQQNLHKGENTPPSLMPSSSSSPPCKLLTGVMGTTLETCTCGARDRALPFARQLTETLQEPRAGSTHHPEPAAPWAQSATEQAPGGPRYLRAKAGISLQPDTRKGRIWLGWVLWPYREAVACRQRAGRKRVKHKGWGSPPCVGWSRRGGGAARSLPGFPAFPACLNKGGLSAASCWDATGCFPGWYPEWVWIKRSFKKTLNKYQR